MAFFGRFVSSGLFCGICFRSLFLGLSLGSRSSLRSFLLGLRFCFCFRSSSLRCFFCLGRFSSLGSFLSFRCCFGLRRFRLCGSSFRSLRSTGHYIIFFFPGGVNNRYLLTEDGNLVGCNVGSGAIGCSDFTFFNFAIVADVEFRYFALNRTGLGDSFGVDDADIFIQQSFVVASSIQRQDVFAVGDGYGIVTDSNNGLIGNEFYTAVPVSIFDGDSCYRAVLSIDKERFADAQLAAFRNADDRKTKDFYTFLH